MPAAPAPRPAPAGPVARPLRQRVGAAGEAAAVRHLVAAGYTVLAVDWRCRLGQVDIVARDGDVLVVIEVKARRGVGFGRPEEAVDARKQRRLQALLEAYRLRTGATGPCRIDVVGVLLDARLEPREVTLVRNAVDG